MVLLSIRKIKKSFGDKEVLKDINLDIKFGKVMGLVGGNGSGKSTLVNIITDAISPDRGVIEFYKQNVRIGYLRQSTFYNANMFKSAIYKNDASSSHFLETSSKLMLKNVNAWSEEKFDGLSGGEKTKLSLSDIWVNKPELLILDEPTNHLDFEGVKWLINSIKQFDGTTIIISHDRYFLDQVVDEIAELDNGKITMYNGNYSYYRKEKKLQYNTQLHQYEEQRKREKQIENEINRLKQWSSKAHRQAPNKALKAGCKKGGKEFYRKKAKKKDRQIKSAIKRIEKLRVEGVTRPNEEQDIQFQFSTDNKRGKSMIYAEEIVKQYQDKILIKPSNFYINRSEKVGLVGVNGCGKTTLIKMILGIEKLTSGNLSVSSTIKIAYLSQDVLDLSNNSSTVNLINKYDKLNQTKARLIFKKMGITSEMLEQKIETLSLGERTRIKLGLLILEENDVLILDEPTNHLDLHSREQLEKTLDEYLGTIIIASHDVYLLEKITTKLLLFERDQVKRVEYGYKDYMLYKQKQDKNHLKNELMLIENKISTVLGQLSKYSFEDEQYQLLDKQFNELITKKNELTNDNHT